MFPEVRDFVNQDLPLLYPLKSCSKVSRSVLQKIVVTSRKTKLQLAFINFPLLIGLLSRVKPV